MNYILKRNPLYISYIYLISYYLSFVFSDLTCGFCVDVMLASTMSLNEVTLHHIYNAILTYLPQYIHYNYYL